MKECKTKKNILILGGYSHENRGDHAMLIGLVNWLKKMDPLSDLIVYATRPAYLKDMLNVRCVWSPECYFEPLLQSQKQDNAVFSVVNRLFSILLGMWFILNFILFKHTSRSLIRKRYCLGFYRQILDSKALFLSGGGYMNSIWWLEGLYAKMFCIVIAKMEGVPVLLTSQGIGPFKNYLDRLTAGIVLKCSAVVGVRDGNKSRSLAAKLGVKADRVVHTGDDSLLMDETSEARVNQIMESEGILGDRVLVGVNVRDVSGYRYDYEGPVCSFYARILDRIVDDGKKHVVFIPISFNPGDDDRITAEKIVSAMVFYGRATVVQNKYAPSELKGLISRMSVALGVSYHFLLFALNANIPSLGLYQNEYYKRKIEGLFSLYDLQEYCLDVRNGEQLVRSKISELFRKSGELSRVLTLRNERMKESIREGHSLLWEKANLDGCEKSLSPEVDTECEH